jgi:hypothetical protein
MQSVAIGREIRAEVERAASAVERALGGSKERNMSEGGAPLQPVGAGDLLALNTVRLTYHRWRRRLMEARHHGGGTPAV